MAVSRRNFLRHIAVAAAACAALPRQGWSSTHNPSSKSVNSKSHKTNPAVFQTGCRCAASIDPLTADAIGTGFRVSLPGHETDAQWLRLISVNDLPTLPTANAGLMAVAPKSTAPVVASTGFTLSFNGTAAKLLPQETYVFEHDRLGRFALLIVPSGPGQQSYSAVIVRPE